MDQYYKFHTHHSDSTTKMGNNLGADRRENEILIQFQNLANLTLYNLENKKRTDMKQIPIEKYSRNYNSKNHNS